jgi:hypothetical protein
LARWPAARPTFQLPLRRPNLGIGLTLRRGRTLMHRGRSPNVRSNSRPLLGRGAGGRSPGSFGPPLIAAVPQRDPGKDQRRAHRPAARPAGAPSPARGRLNGRSRRPRKSRGPVAGRGCFRRSHDHRTEQLACLVAERTRAPWISPRATAPGRSRDGSAIGRSPALRSIPTGAEPVQGLLAGLMQIRWTPFARGVLEIATTGAPHYEASG